MSGQVGSDPPVYCVAVKLGRRDKQTHNIVCLSRETHDGYSNCTRNWTEKLSAILIYRAAVDIYSSVDSIVIDHDFEGQRQMFVERCIRRLFGERFFGRYPLNNPTLLFIPEQYDRNVRKADRKSKIARHRNMPYNLKDPDLTREFSWLDTL